ncbi:MAG: nuclear transport factor 2 family protein [Marinicellaceae bacterium]
MNKKINTVLFLLLITNFVSSKNSDLKLHTINATLDTLHLAASKADSKTYFDLFTDNAYFIGTDVSEYWNINDFKVFAKPYFDKGQGWTYVTRSRQVELNESENVAWFHEILDNQSYGTTRGTGVLILVNNQWKISQYHLTIPIPNEMAKEITAKIKTHMSNKTKVSQN